MPQTDLTKASKKAAKLGVTIRPSTAKHKKLDVYRKGQKVASIGDIRYSDFNLHGDQRMTIIADLAIQYRHLLNGM